MRRGFTLIELAIVISIGAILVPIGFMTIRTFEAAERESLARLEAARAMRTVSDALRADLLAMKPVPGATLVLAGSGACGRVSYLVEDDTLVRRGDEACGPAGALARNVASLEVAPAGFVLTFSHRVGRREPLRTPFRFGWPADPPVAVGEVPVP